MTATTTVRAFWRGVLLFVAATLLTTNTAAASQLVYARTFPGTGHASIMLDGLDLTPDSSDNRNASWSPDGKQIAFQSNREGGSKIFVMNSNGTNPSSISKSSSSDSMPSWSPDGSRLVFVRGGNLYTMKPNGDDPQPVTHNEYGYPSAPKWSPDGSKVVFFDYEGSRYHVWTVSPDGGNPNDLTGDSGISATDPTWSPDGSRIAFSGYVDGYHSWDIYTMTSGGKEIRDITEDIGVSQISDSQPVWSGGVITFVTTRGDNRDFRGHLAKMTDTGGGYTSVTDVTGNYTDSAPAFSSSGAADVKSYVALGDSVAAGEGINYAWTWKPDAGGLDGVWQIGNPNPTWMGDSSRQVCHQSAQGYPYLLAARKNMVLTDLACTGAAGDNGILSPQTREGQTLAPQLGGVDGQPANRLYDAAKPDIVTLDIGANDVNFAQVVKTCYGNGVDDCGSSSSIVNDQTVQPWLAQQRLNLSTILREIVNRGQAAGKVPQVLLVNYANPFPKTYIVGCHDLVPQSLLAFLSPTEMQWLIDQLGKLNANIAAEAAKFDNVKLVDIRDVYQAKNSTDRGHTFCSGSPWVYGAKAGFDNVGNPSPFHPSPQGQDLIAGKL